MVREHSTVDLRKTHTVLNWFESLAARSSLLSKAYEEYHLSRMSSPIDRVAFRQDARVLFVGGGYIPYSAIYIALEKGLVVDVIDNRVEVIDSASKMIERRGVQDRVKVFLGDGMTFPITLYDAIFIAMHVLPKKSTVERLIRDAKEGAKIVFRNPSVPNRFEHYLNCSELPTDLVEVEEIRTSRPHPLAFDSYILTVKGR